MKKILFVGGIIIGTVIVYILITGFWGVIRDAAEYATNQTDNATFPLSYAVTSSAPVWLYFLPAIIAIIAIVWKLRSNER